MPYIKAEQRPPIEEAVNAALDHIDADGKLNFAISKLIDGYAEKMGRNYMTYNAIIGVLECAKLEYYRRRIALYEIEKAAQNGEVFE